MCIRDREYRQHARTRSAPARIGHQRAHCLPRRMEHHASENRPIESPQWIENGGHGPDRMHMRARGNLGLALFDPALCRQPATLRAAAVVATVEGFFAAVSIRTLSHM